MELWCTFYLEVRESYVVCRKTWHFKYFSARGSGKRSRTCGLRDRSCTASEAQLSVASCLQTAVLYLLHGPLISSPHIHKKQKKLTELLHVLRLFNKRLTWKRMWQGSEIFSQFLVQTVRKVCRANESFHTVASNGWRQINMEHRRNDKLCHFPTRTALGSNPNNRGESRRLTTLATTWLLHRDDWNDWRLVWVITNAISIRPCSRRRVVIAHSVSR